MWGRERELLSRGRHRTSTELYIHITSAAPSLSLTTDELDMEQACVTAMAMLPCWNDICGCRPSDTVGCAQHHLVSWRAGPIYTPSLSHAWSCVQEAPKTSTPTSCRPLSLWAPLPPVRIGQRPAALAQLLLRFQEALLSVLAAS
eukprot:CAMPEP_0180504146 /NCGR_PEP_ID=MMETSP1036_2-20121128/46518_1 /TAXON_ID=632150 /ORGANISM="Azadinium spinosum, Strain 3D9" /LENGTH=144 /DNA_ID=CAMNT_0022513437 /DNA_START=68 /DNA_END=499 /DNA_ORIENTATION=-